MKLLSLCCSGIMTILSLAVYYRLYFTTHSPLARAITPPRWL